MFRFLFVFFAVLALMGVALAQQPMQQQQRELTNEEIISATPSVIQGASAEAARLAATNSQTSLQMNQLLVVIERKDAEIAKLQAQLDALKAAQKKEKK